jgi:hypothetical protein
MLNSYQRWEILAQNNRNKAVNILKTVTNPELYLDKVAFFSQFSSFEDKKDWLWLYIKREFGVEIPRVGICPGHCAPFDFVAEVVFQQVDGALAMANRDGGKTYDMALIQALEMRFYDEMNLYHIGAIELQAKKCYEDFKGFLSKPAFNDIRMDTLISNTVLKNGSTLKIAPGTVNATNSQHPHKTFFDEVELTKWSVLQEFWSMSKSETSKGFRACDVLGSTRKYSYGVMQQLLDQIDSGEIRGVKKYLWCIWEILEPFRLKPEWKELRKRDRDGNEISFYDLAAPFEGRTNGFYGIDDAVKKFSNMSLETWFTQWECKAPSKEGLIYGSEFDERDILKDVWQYDPQYPVFAGQDFGDTNPMATLFYQQIAPKKYVLFDECYENKVSASNYAKRYLIPRQLKYNFKFLAHDPSGAGFAREMKEARDKDSNRIYTMFGVKCNVEERIQLVKTKHENHEILVSPNCKEYIREKKAYHYIDGTDTPAKEDDHTQDAEGYLMWKLEGKKEAVKQKAYGTPIMISSKNRII